MTGDSASRIVDDRYRVVRLPVPLGLKLALTVQLAPTARLVPHVLLWVKSPGLVRWSSLVPVVLAHQCERE